MNDAKKIIKEANKEVKKDSMKKSKPEAIKETIKTWKDKNLKEAMKTWKDNFRIISFIVKNAIKLSRTFLPCSITLIIITSVNPFINIVFPKYIIDELTGAQRIDIIIYLILLLTGLNFLFRIVNKVLVNYLQVENEKIYIEFSIMLGKKATEMDYEYIEDPEILDLKAKAADGFNYYGGMWRLSTIIINIVAGVITLSGLFYIIFQINSVIVLVLLIIVVICSYHNDRLQKIIYSFWDRLRTYNRKYRYINSIMLDFKYGKDIRLYDMSEMILSKNRSYVDETYAAYKEQTDLEDIYIRGRAIVNQFQVIVVYAYLTYKVFMGHIGLGSFTMFASAAKSFTDTIIGLIKAVISIHRACQYTKSFVDFLMLPDIKVRGKLSVKQLSIKQPAAMQLSAKQPAVEHLAVKQPAVKQLTAKQNESNTYENNSYENDIYEIEFRNVSFKYPKSEIMVLKNVNIKIKNNQKLSVVGLNGAGKTTFIKLMIRLYDPTEGCILLNGTDIRELGYDEYLSLFSVVFQDFNLIAASIRENIAPTDEASETVDLKVMDAVKKAGLQSKIDELGKGLDTQLYKIFDENGTDLSGGQAQKLALARAVYKNAPIIVLDEPTAALDPLAEYEIYQHFDQLIGKKTTIYVSHRMSSCRFCDVIAVFDGGTLAQYGTHDELMTNKNGLYYKLFTAQAQYYV